MCTYLTEKTEIFGSAKGPQGWFKVDTANIYFDHPVHVQLEHSLNIDFVNEAQGYGTRVAVEMSPESARQLVAKILAILESGEAAVLQVPADVDWIDSAKEPARAR
jgi:hypothetical protein